MLLCVHLRLALTFLVRLVVVRAVSVLVRFGELLDIITPELYTPPANKRAARAEGAL